MILKMAYVRFYRAFNFDYLRKRNPDSTPDPWDKMEDESFYPYIRLQVDPEFTAVVGANESGKSQLLQAIECALGTRQPTPADFCRYSTHFTVAEAMKTPHFGLYFESLTKEEADSLSSAIDLDDNASVTSFHIFRTNSNDVVVYLNGQAYALDESVALDEILPRVFRIDPRRAIPNSVPISFLIARGTESDVDPGPTRSDRWALVSPVVENASNILSTLSNPQSAAQTLQQILQGIHAPGGSSENESRSYLNELNLAFDLLITVGGIHVSALRELQKALRNEDEGLANGIVSSMNDQLERSLNLARWWSQDSEFRLAIAVRDFDIVFTIRDRTGSEYSFAERSSGLKYFLSYLVQFLAHARDRRRSEILLMDEPDAYLSSEGQQDLLRLLHEFTLPTDVASGGQVLYVTHSPFLIDKNRADRIRVLDKGSGNEGVRVVRDVGRNHFEPLRTALGGFVGETAFIGNCNLMLEGIADQVYLAGMSDLLARTGVASTERFDLNRITLVPVGSASHIPYMTYLARGRDSDKPAVIVLLDGDEEGDLAVKELSRGGPRRKQVIRPDYVAQLKSGEIDGVSSDDSNGPNEIEDLIPVEIAISASKTYIREVGAKEPETYPSDADVRKVLSQSKGIFGSIQSALEKAGSDVHLDKVGFARHVLVAYEQSDTEARKSMGDRFVALFSHLTAMQRKAERERERESISARVDREVYVFLRDNLTRATKADVLVLLERIEDLIDRSIEGDALLIGIRRIKDEFDLSGDLSVDISDRDGLADGIESLKYAEVLASQPEAQVIRTPGDR